MTDQALRRRVKSGELERIWRGHYLTTGGVSSTPEDERFERYRLTVMAAARGSVGDRVVSHTSAAALHALPLLKPDVGVVHFTTSSTGRTGGRAAIHQAPLPISDVTIVDGVRVTSLARTICDTARLGTFAQALTVVDQGLRRGVGIDDLRRITRSQARWHGVGVLRRAVAAGDARSESVGESFSRAVILGFDDIPAPDLQVPIRLAAGVVVYGDFGWEGKAVGEFDGFIKYSRSRPFDAQSSDQVLFAEKRREDAIRDLGIVPIRWVWADVSAPDRLHRKLHDGLRRAGVL